MRVRSEKCAQNQQRAAKVRRSVGASASTSGKVSVSSKAAILLAMASPLEFDNRLHQKCADCPIEITLCPLIFGVDTGTLVFAFKRFHTARVGDRKQRCAAHDDNAKAVERALRLSQSPHQGHSIFTDEVLRVPLTDEPRMVPQ